MTWDTIDPAANFLLLEPDGTSVRLPGGRGFWNQVMSGNASDPGIQQLLGSAKGRLLSLVPLDRDWTHWEMHPAGDEVLFMLEGAATFIFDLPPGHHSVDFAAGRLLVVPQGVWHIAKVQTPGRLLAFTAGAGTGHRPA